MMTRGLLAAGVLFLMISSAGFAQGFVAGDKTFTLSGSGSSDDDMVDNAFSVDASLGYFFADAWEVAIRQRFSLLDVPGDNDDWSATTRGALDWNFFTNGPIVPFIGASVGYTYGDLVDDTCIGGPEGGIRWFMNETTYLLLMVEYQFFFDSGDEVDDRFDDGQFIYTAGIGFKF